MASSLQVNNMLTRAPTMPEIGNFLVTRSGKEMLQLMQSMRDPCAQAALTTALLLAPPATSGKVTTPEKAKKALNAFVGFRCYYILIPVLKQWPMKSLSSLMGIMWDEDPNKALWSLMTKAWSIIRDQIGKNQAPLDQFFRIICPHLNIPSPETYLDHVGWVVTTDANGMPTVSRMPANTSESAVVAVEAAALSVEDIIRYCQSMGYAQEYVLDIGLASSTFLGHSIDTNPSSAVRKAIQDKRELRRLKRKMARDSGFAAGMQEGAKELHRLSGLPGPEDDGLPPQFTNEAGDERDPFYDNLPDLLANHLAAIESSAATEDAVPDDCSAFRLGADPNAHLPTYDWTSI